MTVETGSVVRLLIEVLADDNAILPPGARATVIGYAGERLVIEVDDPESGETHSAEVERWEVRS